MSDIVADDVCRFWFEDVEKTNWFKQSDSFDTELKGKYGELLEQAKRGELDHWCDCAEGYLGLIIVLDQFSRNIHRDSPEAFAADEKALVLATELIEKELDKELTLEQRSFAYLPFRHAEDLIMQHIGLKKTREINAEGYGSDKYAVGHLSIIERFGRFPHRNAILGRENTSDEETYLAGKALGV
ncbi:MAG: DUF924 family protein [Woeseiaceae bacterium]